MWQIKSWSSFLIRAYSPARKKNPFVDQCWQALSVSSISINMITAIEEVRTELHLDHTIITRTDFGANGKNHYNQSISHLAQLSLSPAAQMAFLAGLIKEEGCTRIVEMGTCLGIGTAYLSQANIDAHVLTLEGDPALAAIAQKNWSRLQLKNIQLNIGAFDDTLSLAMMKFGPVDFIFLDGHHDGKAMHKYWNLITPHLKEGAVICVDDIRWSPSMYSFWTHLISLPQLKVSIDAGKIGLCKWSVNDQEPLHFVWRMLPVR